MDLKVGGMGQLERVARLCNEAADRGIRRKVTKALNEATEPAKDEIRKATDRLPQRGGLGELVANAKISTRTQLKGRNPSVRMTDRWSGHDLRRIDAGRVRHPVPNSGTHVNQKVPPGFWSDTLKRQRRNVQRRVIFAMEDVAHMVTRG